MSNLGSIIYYLWKYGQLTQSGKSLFLHMQNEKEKGPLMRFNKVYMRKLIKAFLLISSYRKLLIFVDHYHSTYYTQIVLKVKKCPWIALRSQNWFDFCDGRGIWKKKISQSDFKLVIVTEEPIPSLEEKRSSFYTFSVWS